MVILKINNRVRVLISLCCFVINSFCCLSNISAQERPHGKVEIEKSNSQSQNLSFISVKDSLNGDYLYGSYITITEKSGKVTNINFSAKYHTINITNIKDSVDILVHHLGYYPIRQKIRLQSEYHYTFFLSEKSEKLSEIVIKGRQAAVVSKGDTMKFNMSAFKTLHGDSFRNALKKFPGFEVAGKHIKYNGVVIEKFLINSERLFVNESQLLIDELKAEDVLNVSVYDTISEWDALNKIQHAKKIRVADVTTKKKIRAISNAKVYSAAQLEKLHNIDNSRYRPSYVLNGNITSAKVGQNLYVENNMYTGSGITNGTTTAIAPSLRFNKDKMNDYSLSNSLQLRRDYTNTPTNSYKEYLDNIANYTPQRISTTEALLKDTKYSIESGNDFSKTFKDKSRYSAALNLHYTNEERDNSQKDIYTLQQDTLTNSLLYNKDNNKRLYTYFRSGYSKYWEKPQINSSVAFNLTYTHTGENGTRSGNIMNDSNIDENNTLKNKNYNYNFYLTLSKDISKKFSLSLKEQLSKEHERYRRTYIDNITNKIDTGASGIYTKHDFSNSTTISANLYLKKFSVSFDGGYDIVSLDLNEDFPFSSNETKRFSCPEWAVSADYKVNNFITFSTNFSSSEKVPSMEQLREQIDNTTPFALKVGNDKLQNMKVYNGSSNINIASSGFGSLTLSTELNIKSNYITSVSQYFKEDTYLSKYHYTALKGATLYTYENLNKRFSGYNLDAKYSNYIYPIATSFSIYAKYFNNITPTIVEKKEVGKESKGNRYGMSVTTGFSKSMEYSLSYNYSESTNTLCEYRNSIYSHFATLTSRFSIHKILSIYSSMNYSKRHGTFGSNGDYSNFIMDISLGHKFTFKGGSINISIASTNIFDKVIKDQINVTEFYRELYNTEIKGRTIMFSISLRLDNPTTK